MDWTRYTLENYPVAPHVYTGDVSSGSQRQSREITWMAPPVGMGVPTVYHRIQAPPYSWIYGPCHSQLSICSTGLRLVSNCRRDMDDGAL